MSIKYVGSIVYDNIYYVIIKEYYRNRYYRKLKLILEVGRYALDIYLYNYNLIYKPI